MNKLLSLVAQASILVITASAASTAVAHPGSGIVVDQQGVVYFVDTGVNSRLGLWKVDRQNRLARHPGPHYHFMAIDPKSQLASMQLPKGVEAVGKDPTLLISGDHPVTVGSDGALYYPKLGSARRVQIMRLSRSDRETVFATLPYALESGANGQSMKAQWIHGLASGPDRCLYYSERYAVRKIAADGVVTLVAGDIKVPDCERPPGAEAEGLAPSLRGLDVKSDGTVYVAASVCSAVLSITPTGTVNVVLRGSDSWSPTGVAISGNNVYVLEYLHTNTHQREDWLPRVRMISPDGSAMLIANVTKELRRTTETP